MAHKLDYEDLSFDEFTEHYPWVAGFDTAFAVHEDTRVAGLEDEQWYYDGKTEAEVVRTKAGIAGCTAGGDRELLDTRRHGIKTSCVYALDAIIKDLELNEGDMLATHERLDSFQQGVNEYLASNAVQEALDV